MARLLLVPFLATLAFTLLRLTGDLLRWSPIEPYEIAWLVPIFGVYLGAQLARESAPPAPGTILTTAALPAVLFVTGLALFRPTSGAMAVISVLAVVLVRRVWPRLNSALFGYALAARVPVAIAMLAATSGEWETVYDVAPFSLAAGLLPQLTVWIGFTVLVGTLSAALFLRVKMARDREPLGGSTAMS